MAEQNQNKIPLGWQKAKVGSFLKLKNGYAFKSADYVDAGEDTVPVIRISDIKIDGANAEKAIHISTRKAVIGFEVEDGDQLIAMSGATTGKVGIYRGDSPAYQNQRVGNLKLISEENFNKQFKNYLIKEKSQAILDVAHGGAQPNVSARGVEELEVLVPPLQEQKRIVEKLDSLLAQVEIIQQRLNNLPDIIKRFRQSVLAAAVSGKLTEQWREEHSYSAAEQLDKLQIAESEYIGRKLRDERTKIFKEKSKLRKEIGHFDQINVPAGWVRKPFFEFCLLNRGFDLPTAKRVDGEYPIMSSGGLIGTHNEYKVEAPVITVGRSGSVGKVFFSNKNSWPLNTSLYVKNFGICEPYYLYLALKGFNLEQYASSSAVPSLNRNEFMFIETLIPPREEQTEIVRLVEQYFALADRLEKHLANAKARVDNLTQSILGKAFRGELVPQDPNDEPADKLLERIKAARLEAEKLEKAAKKAAKVKR